MPNEPLRIGFLGVGRISDLQCLGYLDHPRARIVAVCDVDEGLARARAEAWGADRVYTEAEKLFADPEIDAVEILTPHQLHAQHAIAALEAGKHVSLQKPPTRTLAEFDSVAAAAEGSDRRIRVFENFMHYPPHVRARELIDAGAIGDPLSIRIKTAGGRLDTGWDVGPGSMAWRMRREDCGGGPTTFDHGYHCYHMAQFLMPEPVDRVHAWIHWMQLGEDAWYDGPALLSWRYAGEVPRFGSWEVIASLGMQVRSDYYVSDDRMEIHGSEGILWVNRCTGKLLDEPALVLYREGETRAFHDLETDWAASFRMGGRAFVNALLDGGPAPQDLASARETLVFALAAGRSAEQGREVALSEIRGD